MTTSAPSPLAVALRADAGGPSARLERRVRGTIEDVWSAITRPDRIARWLAPTSLHGAAAEGVHYTIEFGSGGDTTGRVLACRAPDHLAVSWELPGEAPSTVVVDLVADDEDVVLVLDHRRLPTSMAIGYAAGWDAYVARLVADVAGEPAPDWDERFATMLPAYREAFPHAAMTPTGFVLGHRDRPVVVVEREVAAPPAQVWSAWTEPERLARWLGAVDHALAGAGAVVHMAMAQTELPDDFAAAENPTTLTVLESVAPTDGADGRLVFRFEDRADPGGVVTVTMAAAGVDRCRLVLQHALVEAPTALAYSAGFGGGWDSFLDWLDDAIAGREHGPDERYEPLTPYYDGQRDRVARTSAGQVDTVGDRTTVRHRRTIAGSAEEVWALLTTPAGLARWLGEIVEGRFGDGERVVVHHDAADPSQRQTSRITGWAPPHRLAMTWEYVGEPESVVEITLDPAASGTELTLTHSDLLAPGGYLAGWHAHLDVLSAVAEGSTPPPWGLAYAAARATVD